jgi:hypothetical protein
MRGSSLSVAVVLVLAGWPACTCDDGVTVILPQVVGPICSIDGVPLPDTDVVATPDDGGPAKTGTTDADGQLSMQLAQGAYAFAVLDRAPFPIVVEVAPGQNTFLFEDPACRPPPVVPTTCEVDGSICNRHTGELVQAGEVFVLADDGAIYSDVTDEQGQFTLANLPPGEHVLTVRAPSFTRSFLVDCVAGETVQLEYGDGCDPTAINECEIEGNFCDPATGGNLVGATVVARKRDSNEEFREVTDTDGSFFLNSLPVGEYDVVVQHESGVGYTMAETPCEAGVTTRLLDPAECADRPQFGALEGRVCADTGGGFYVGKVSIFRGGVFVADAQTEADGRFSFRSLAPGPYSVVLVDATPVRTYERTVEVNETTFIDEPAEDCVDPPVEVCATIDVPPTQTQDGRILLVVDRSGSMDQDANNSNLTKWEAMREVLSDVVVDLSSDVEFGLVLYPSPQSGDSCAEGTEEVALGAVTGSAIAARMNEVNANGNTPTARSLLVAKELIEPYLGDGRPISVLLATDGAPNCRSGCFGGGNQCSDTNATLAAAQELRDTGVLTYVVGVQSDSTFEDVLNELAVIGGTALPGTRRFYDAADPVALRSALEAIVQRVASCRVDVTQSLYSATSVSVKLGTVDVPRDTTRQNGWDIVSTFTIELYGDACAALTDVNASDEDTTVHVERCEQQ